MSAWRASKGGAGERGGNPRIGLKTAIAIWLFSLGAALDVSAQISISTIEDLQKIGNDPGYPLNGVYVLANAIDASATATWNSGAGFAPIGTQADPFTGSLDGQSFVISGLFIHRPSAANVGLFGYIQGTTIQNLGLDDAQVTGSSQVAMLAGYLKIGTISNCYAEGTVSALQFAGGLVGLVQDTVSNSHASGMVEADNGAGGLVGLFSGVSLSGCSSTARVSGQTETGGLIGYHGGGAVTTSFATGAVTGAQNVGGLAGSTQGGGSVANCYATGPVNGDLEVGGLVGLCYGSITRCYAAGLVTGSSGSGGLAGDGVGSITESFWDLGTSGNAASAGGTGLSTAAMLQQANFAPPWDFASVWTIVEASSYPYLRTNTQNPPPDPAPHAISITPLAAGPTNATSAAFTVIFDQQVINFGTADDVVVTHSGTASTGVNLSGSGDTYTVTVSGISGDGSFTLAVSTASDVQDLLGHPLAYSVTSPALTIDNTPPSVNIGSVTGSPVSVTRTAGFPVTISGAGAVSLSGVNVTLNHSGTAGGTVNILNGTSTTPTVQVSGVTGDGTYTISIDAGIAIDAAGNLSVAAGPSASAATVDNTGPSVSIGTPTGSPVNSSGTARFPVTISGSSSVALSSFHVSLQHSGTFGGSVSIQNGSTATPTVRVTGVSGNGSYTLSIASGIASDALDNTSPATAPSASGVAVDNIAPALAISAPATTLTETGPVSFTVDFTGADSVALAESDIALNATGNATGEVLVSGSGNSIRTVTIQNIAGDGTLGITIAPGTASDDAGNLASGAGPSSTFQVDAIENVPLPWSLPGVALLGVALWRVRRGKGSTA